MSSKVLLVEDNATTNFLNKLVLNNAGIQDINEALNGLDAYNFLQKDCPDIILLDINMPVMDGWEFLREKETRTLCMESKVVILTSSTRPEDKKKAENYSSIIAYLEKPLTQQKFEQLKQKIS